MAAEQSRLLQIRLQKCESCGGRELDLRDLNLSSLPVEVFRFSATLEFLNLGGNALTSLPEQFAQLQKLKILFFAGNAFQTFPEVLGQLSSLYMVSFKANKLRYVPERSLSPSVGWLILTDNLLTELPESIGKLSNLKKCMLASNRLKRLPEAMRHCSKLELLRISMNELEEFPKFLMSMPMLSWVAVYGNPFCATPGEPKLPVVNMKALELGEKLGEGASGEVFKATWNREEEKREVAVKLFKGSATSDGSPLDEMNLVMLIGSHPSSIKPLGKVEGAKAPGLGKIPKDDASVVHAWAFCYESSECLFSL